MAILCKFDSSRDSVTARGRAVNVHSHMSIDRTATDRSL